MKKYMGFFTVSVLGDDAPECYPGFMVMKDGKRLSDSLIPIAVVNDYRCPVIVGDRIMEGFVLVNISHKRFNPSGCCILKIPEAIKSTDIFVHLYIDSSIGVKAITNNRALPRLHEVDMVGAAHKRESMIFQLKPGEFFQVESKKVIRTYRNVSGVLVENVEGSLQRRNGVSFSQHTTPPPHKHVWNVEVR